MAACTSEDPELFFPLPHARPQIRHAKAVCAACPVRLNCLHLALGHGLDHGIFGGFTAEERRGLVRHTSSAGTANKYLAARATSSCVAGRPRRPPRRR
ncbi:WhiB family transcriptional regulator [Amycolatopsis sp. NPDC005232]|uniref:WhiB family transcriptional regulator n=1 Tax=Amycolatopsis sp. NPDC005232 TaxID=3157027 RepID=UPI0033B0B04A